MGICGSASSNTKYMLRKKNNKISSSINQSLYKSYCEDQMICKMMLLGASASGKSTLYKQINTIFGQGFHDWERDAVIPILVDNIIQSMKTLCKQSTKFSRVTAVNITVFNLIRNITDDHTSLNDTIDGYGDLSIGNAIKQLWKDENIQMTYMQRSKFVLDDSSKYYFDKIDQIMAPKYIPTDEDMIRVRIPTTGIVKTEFVIDNQLIHLYDVGGQRSERRKWIHCFTDVSAVLFMASLSAYDEIVYEDNVTNRMIEAMELFDEIANSQWFKSSALILFLNKRDLFKEKLQTVPLESWFPNEVQVPNVYENGLTFIQQQFLKYIENDRSVYTHFTCATDKKNIETVCLSAMRIMEGRRLQNILV